MPLPITTQYRRTTSESGPRQQATPQREPRHADRRQRPLENVSTIAGWIVSINAPRRPNTKNRAQRDRRATARSKRQYSRPLPRPANRTRWGGGVASCAAGSAGTADTCPSHRHPPRPPVRAGGLRGEQGEPSAGTMAEPCGASVQRHPTPYRRPHPNGIPASATHDPEPRPKAVVYGGAIQHPAWVFRAGWQAVEAPRRGGGRATRGLRRALS